MVLWSLKISLTVKVEGSRTVLVHLFDDVVEVFVGQFVVQLLQDLLQRVSRDVSVAYRKSKDIKKNTYLYP